MIDSHVHLDFKEFDRDREETIKRFFDASGEKMINVGCDLASSIRSVELAGKHKNIFASIGVHPHDAEKLDNAGMEKLEELATEKKVVAIGEIGLDYFRPEYSGLPKEKQIEAFKMQLGLAQKHKKPVIIHCRDAYVEMLEILKSYNPPVNGDPVSSNNSVQDRKGVMHCFLGSWPIAEELLKLGFYLGFTGAITYQKKSVMVTAPASPKFKLGEPEIFNVIKNTPLDRILIETDCPYLAPVPHRGERNEPSFVKHVAEKIAEIKGVSFEKIEKATSENAGKLFGI